MTHFTPLFPGTDLFCTFLNKVFLFQAMELLELATRSEAVAETFRVRACSFRQEAVSLMQTALKTTRASGLTEFMSAFMTGILPDNPQVIFLLHYPDLPITPVFYHCSFPFGASATRRGPSQVFLGMW